MKAPRWLMFPFYWFAPHRYFVPIVISIILVFYVIFTTEIKSTPELNFLIKTLTNILFVVFFFIQYQLDQTRDEWETNKKSYHFHEWRHRIYALSLLVFGIYFFLASPINWPIHFINAMIIFEIGTLARHAFDPENIPGAMAPPRPV